ncbi:beta-tectorin-like [Ciona intestinalis]
MTWRKFNVSVLLCLLLALQGFAAPCDSNPCENNGECVVTSASEYSCICPSNFAGIRCNLPPPTVSCGEESIEVSIDKRIVIEQGLADDTNNVYFKGASGCNAEDRNGAYHLSVAARFGECGFQVLQRENSYMFKQQVVWNMISTSVERPTVLVDITCNYTRNYAVLAGPIIPTVNKVDFQTSYGVFTVQMELYRNQQFSEDAKFGRQLVIPIEQEVCVEQSLINVMPDHLVLSLLRCWASTVSDGTGDVHELISEKCASDPTALVMSNGQNDTARFCFTMFKWRESMNSVYLHCMVNVCNVTAYPEFCQCQSERKKRNAPMTSERQRRDSTMVSTGLITIVPKGTVIFADPGLNEAVLGTAESPLIPGSNPVDGGGSNSTVLIAVGVVLVTALIVLGVVIAVYVSHRRTNMKKKQRKRGKLAEIVNRRRHLPVA